MYTVKLDENGYFVGPYGVENSGPSDGVQVYELPPDMNKCKFYQHGTFTKTITVSVPDIDETTGEQKVNDDGDPLFKDEEQTIPYVGWKFDEQKYIDQTRLELQNKKIMFIDKYKHEARLYFPYGNVGGVQRFADEDIIFINLQIESIEKGMTNGVMWKYSNGEYEFANLEYLTKMKTVGGLYIVKAFEAEKNIVDTIKNITSIDDLSNFDEKVEFDKEFKKLVDLAVSNL